MKHKKKEKKQTFCSAKKRHPVNETGSHRKNVLPRERGNRSRFVVHVACSKLAKIVSSTHKQVSAFENDCCGVKTAMDGSDVLAVKEVDLLRKNNWGDAGFAEAKLMVLVLSPRKELAGF